MSIKDGAAREYFVWKSWLLGSISDSQVSCLSPGTFNVNLSYLGANANTLKMIVVKFIETKTLVVESRPSTTYDTITKEGVLVYLVDTSVNMGLGHIKVLPINTNYESKFKNIFDVGESITYSYFNVTLVSSGSNLVLFRNKILCLL